MQVTRETGAEKGAPFPPPLSAENQAVSCHVSVYKWCPSSFVSHTPLSPYIHTASTNAA